MYSPRDSSPSPSPSSSSSSSPSPSPSPSAQHSTRGRSLTHPISLLWGDRNKKESNQETHNQPRQPSILETINAPTPTTLTGMPIVPTGAIMAEKKFHTIPNPSSPTIMAPATTATNPTNTSPASAGRSNLTASLPVDRSECVSPTSAVATAANASASAGSGMAANRGIVSGLTQQLKKWRGYSPIHIQTSASSSTGVSTAPSSSHSRFGSNQSGDAVEAIASDSSDDTLEDAIGTGIGGRDSPLFANNQSYRHRSNTVTGPSAASGVTSSPRSQNVNTAAYALAGLPPPLSHTQSLSSNGSASTGGYSSGVTSTRTSISFTTDQVLSPTDEATTPEPANRALPTSSSFSSTNGTSNRRRRHSSFFNNTRPSFSTPTHLATTQSDVNLVVPPASSSYSASSRSRRSTLSGSGLNSFALLNDSYDPTSEPYVALLQKVLQRTAPVDVDIFRIDQIQAAATSTATNTVASSTEPNSPPATLTSSQPHAASSQSASSSSASLSSADPIDPSSISSSPAATLAELVALATTYRDELILERFYRKHAQAQLNRRISTATVAPAGQANNPPPPSIPSFSPLPSVTTSTIAGNNSPLPSLPTSPPGSAGPSKSHSLSLPFASPLISSPSSLTPPPPLPNNVSTTTAATTTTTTAGVAYALEPSHLELCLDLKTDEYDALQQMFERYKQQSTQKYSALQQYVRTLEAKLQSNNNNSSSIKSNAPQVNTGESTAMVPVSTSTVTNSILVAPSIPSSSATVPPLPNVDVVSSDLQLRLSHVQQSYDRLQSDHAELSRRHFLLGHKFSTVHSTLREMPNQLVVIETLSNRIQELEHSHLKYVDQIEGRNGLKQRFHHEVQTLTTQLAETETTLEQARAQVTALQAQLLALAQEKDGKSQTVIEELKAILEYQQKMTAAKIISLTTDSQSLSKLNSTLQQRLLELEIQLAQTTGTSLVTSTTTTAITTTTAAANAGTGASLAMGMNSPTTPMTSSFPTNSSVNMNPSNGPLTLSPIPTNSALPINLLPFRRPSLHAQSHSQSSVPFSSSSSTNRNDIGRSSPAVSIAISNDSNDPTSGYPSRFHNARSPFGHSTSSSLSGSNSTSTSSFSEKSAPIPITIPTPPISSFNSRPRSSSRGIMINGNANNNAHTPPDNHRLSANLGGTIISNINPPTAVLSPSVIIPPHELNHRNHATRRDRTTVGGDSTQLDHNSSEDELLEDQFSPSSPTTFKKRIYSPTLA